MSGLFGQVLISEKDYEKLHNNNFESERVKDLERQRDYWQKQFEKATNDPNSFLRGRRYSSKIVRECIETLKICEDKRLGL